MIVSSASPLLRMVSANSRCSALSGGVEQEPAHADHGVHRRADLVAHLARNALLAALAASASRRAWSSSVMS